MSSVWKVQQHLHTYTSKFILLMSVNRQNLHLRGASDMKYNQIFKLIVINYVATASSTYIINLRYLP